MHVQTCIQKMRESKWDRRQVERRKQERGRNRKRRINGTEKRRKKKRIGEMMMKVQCLSQ